MRHYFMGYLKEESSHELFEAAAMTATVVRDLSVREVEISEEIDRLLLCCADTASGGEINTKSRGHEEKLLAGPLFQPLPASMLRASTGLVLRRKFSRHVISPIP